MDRDIFLKCVLKAEKNGYKDHLAMLPCLPSIKTSADLLVSKLLWQRRYEIAFSHSFAKAFFDRFNGNSYSNPSDCYYTKDNWKKCLVNMVLEKDPIAYLEEFLDA